MEYAAGGLVGKGGRKARHRLHAQVGQRGDKPLGIGVPRVLKQFPRRVGLQDTAAVHDNDTLAEFAGQQKVVGNDDKADAVLVPYHTEGVVNLIAHHCIQSLGGLICDQPLRTCSHSDGCQYTLAHATGELEGVGTCNLLRVGKGHLPEKLQRESPAVWGTFSSQTEDLLDLASHPHAGIQ